MNIEQTRLQAQNENTAPEILIELARSEDCQTLQYVTSNPNTPVSVLNSLIARMKNESLEPMLFCAIAKNPNVTTATLDRLIVFCNRYSSNLIWIHPYSAIKSKMVIYFAVLENPRTASKTLERMFLNEPSCSARKLCRLMDNHPNKTLTAVNIARFFVGYKDTPHHILERLANHQCAYVRNHVFTHPNIADELLHKLSLSPHENVRKAVAEHSETAYNTICMLAKDNLESVRGKIAERQDLNEEIIDILAQDSSKAVRSKIACHEHY